MLVRGEFEATNNLNGCQKILSLSGFKIPFRTEKKNKNRRAPKRRRLEWEEAPFEWRRDIFNLEFRVICVQMTNSLLSKHEF